MKHVLVSGGAGYIGSHACKLLARQGYILVTFDSLVTGWASAVKFGPFVQGDLLDRAALDAVLPAAEHEQMAGKRVFAQNLIGKRRKAIEALPHILSGLVAFVLAVVSTVIQIRFSFSA